jgi:peptidoglycan-associated lipoprotein
MRSIRFLFIAAPAAVLIAGCAHTKLDEKPAPVVEQSSSTQAPMPAPAPAPAPVARVEAPAPVPVDPLSDPTGALAKRSVYFDFDKSQVRTEYQGLIEAHGRYLVDRASRQVKIEGNCDERGGREYNLALGQRRADAVRERLELVGVPGARVETISFGKEKPKSGGHDETGWAENRRADIVYR